MIEPAVLAAALRQSEAPSERGSTWEKYFLYSADAQCMKNFITLGLSTYPLIHGDIFITSFLMVVRTLFLECPQAFIYAGFRGRSVTIRPFIVTNHPQIAVLSVTSSPSPCDKSASEGIVFLVVIPAC